MIQRGEDFPFAESRMPRSGWAEEVVVPPEGDTRTGVTFAKGRATCSALGDTRTGEFDACVVMGSLLLRVQVAWVEVLAMYPLESLVLR